MWRLAHEEGPSLAILRSGFAARVTATNKVHSRLVMAENQRLPASLQQLLPCENEIIATQVLKPHLPFAIISILNISHTAHGTHIVIRGGAPVAH
jgi:hypothetical protein